MSNINNRNFSNIPKLILLDIYETILDMSEIEKRINRFFDNKLGYALWFELFMQYTFVDNFISKFHDFPAIAGATLRMTAKMLDQTTNADQINEILELLKHLPVKEGVQEGLSGLSDQNFRIAALTNSPEGIVTARMQKSGLISYFEEVLSAEQVEKYKPASEVYLWAARRLIVNPSEILLVSSHGWDIAGAKNAGMQTAHMLHGRLIPYPLAPVADYICKSLPDLCEQLKTLRFNQLSEKI